MRGGSSRNARPSPRRKSLGPLKAFDQASDHRIRLAFVGIDRQIRRLDPAHPIIAEQGARNVYTGRDLAAAIAFSSPLSLPLVADQLPAMLSTVLA